jgi:protein-L-isoaspartate(D-aspartate) O-methyltransferase
MLANDVELARRNMVLQQVRPWEVIDERVLEVIQRVPREAFVPETYLGLAFADVEIPLGQGAAMMAPKLEARMLQALDVRPGDRVLEVGTGSGFVTACLRALGGSVTSLDIHGEFTAAARSRLEELKVDGVRLETADVFARDFGNQNFEVIALTGSLPHYDERFEQLLARGGRLFVVIGEAPAMKATLVQRVGETALRRQGLFETELTALENAPVPEHFVF